MRSSAARPRSCTSRRRDSGSGAWSILVSPLPVFNLYNNAWPIYTSYGPHPPAKLVEGASGAGVSTFNSILSPGVVVSGGMVHRSVLGELILEQLPAGSHVLIMTHDHAEDFALCDAALRLWSADLSASMVAIATTHADKSEECVGCSSRRLHCVPSFKSWKQRSAIRRSMPILLALAGWVGATRSCCPS